MKKLMSLGCLMALVLAGASAFAADWFTTEITTKPTGRGGSWTYTDLTLKEETGGISFNDWNHELVFSAEEAKLASNSNSIIKTTVKFTALDGSEGEVPTAEMTNALPAKAGLTIVEGANGEKTFWGIVSGSWVPLTGNATNALEAAVPVKIEIMKDANNGVFVQYTVDSEILTDDNGQEVLAVGAAGDFEHTLESRRRPRTGRAACYAVRRIGQKAKHVCPAGVRCREAAPNQSARRPRSGRTAQHVR